jgi:hypothetical protein
MRVACMEAAFTFALILNDPAGVGTGRPFRVAAA